MPNCWGVDVRPGGGANACRVPPQELLDLWDDNHPDARNLIHSWCRSKFCDDGIHLTCIDYDGPSQCGGFGSASACNGEAKWQNPDDAVGWRLAAFAMNCCYDRELTEFDQPGATMSLNSCASLFGRPEIGGGAWTPFEGIVLPNWDVASGIPWTSISRPSAGIWPKCLDTKICCRPRNFPEEGIFPCQAWGPLPGSERYDIPSCCSSVGGGGPVTVAQCIADGGTASDDLHCCGFGVDCGAIGSACCFRTGACRDLTEEQCNTLAGRFHAGLSCSEVNCLDGFVINCVQDRWSPTIRADEHRVPGEATRPDSFELISNVPVETMSPEDATQGRNCVQTYGYVSESRDDLGSFGMFICNDYTDIDNGGERKHVFQEGGVAFNDDGDGEFMCSYRQPRFVG